MQAGCMVEWMYDLRPAFEVHRGRGGGIDGFMFHDMLYWHAAPHSHPGSSLVYAPNFNPIYPKPTALHSSPFSLSLLFLLFLSLFVCFYSSAFISLHVSILFSLSPPPVSLLLTPSFWEGTQFFPQCSWWRGLCSSCNEGLNTCFGHITTFISMHEGNKGCSQTLRGEFRHALKTK